MDLPTDFKEAAFDAAFFVLSLLPIELLIEEEKESLEDRGPIKSL